ncbi:MAG TPA: hypothetical protein VNY80_09805 [Steroidobacteraceae bacterium]|nr:hypothetical protein [Steroidobacteraceae bacterium]
MTTAMLASILAAFVLGLVAVFQILLALALPLGHAAWGGAHRVLPARLRLASAVSALPLALAAWIVLARTGVVAVPFQYATVRAATWVAFCVLALNTVANLASKSRVERALMTPAAFVCSVCLLIAALSDP